MKLPRHYGFAPPTPPKPRKPYRRRGRPNFTLRLAPEQLAAARELAARWTDQDVTTADVVREALQRYLASAPTTPPPVRKP